MDIHSKLRPLLVLAMLTPSGCTCDSDPPPDDAAQDDAVVDVVSDADAADAVPDDADSMVAETLIDVPPDAPDALDAADVTADVPPDILDDTVLDTAETLGCSLQACPACPFCEDAVCQDDECACVTADTCCGDGSCGAGEDACSCPGDCPWEGLSEPCCDDDCMCEPDGLGSNTPATTTTSIVPDAAALQPWLCPSGDTSDWFDVSCPEPGAAVRAELKPSADVGGAVLQLRATGPGGELSLTASDGDADGAADIGFICYGADLIKLEVRLIGTTGTVPAGPIDYTLLVASDVGCTSDPACAADNICLNFACVAGCRDQAGCGLGELCTADGSGLGSGACVPGCTWSATCPDVGGQPALCDPGQLLQCVDVPAAPCAVDDGFDAAGYNATPTTASVLALPADETELTLCCQDEDWYAITLAGPANDLTLTLSTSQGKIVPHVVVLDMVDQLVAVGDPAAVGAMTLVVPRLPPGSYRVGVLPPLAFGAEGCSGSAPYELDIATTTAAVPCATVSDCADTVPLRSACNTGACSLLDGGWSQPKGAPCDSADDCGTGLCLASGIGVAGLVGLPADSDAPRFLCSQPCAVDLHCASLGAGWQCLPPGVCSPPCVIDAHCPGDWVCASATNACGPGSAVP